MGKEEDELGVENLPHACYRLLKNRGLSLSVHFYMILPATLHTRTIVTATVTITNWGVTIIRTKSCAKRSVTGLKKRACNVNSGASTWSIIEPDDSRCPIKVSQYIFSVGYRFD